MQQLYSDASRFGRTNRGLLAWLVMAMLLSYGFAFSNFSLSIDEELHLAVDQTYAWTAQGRWGTTFLKLLFGTTFPLPFFQPACAVLVLIGSSLVWCFLFARATGDRLTNSPWLTLFAYFMGQCHAMRIISHSTHIISSCRAGCFLRRCLPCSRFYGRSNGAGGKFCFLLRCPRCWQLGLISLF